MQRDPDFRDPDWPKYGRPPHEPPDVPPGRILTEAPAPDPGYIAGLRNGGLILVFAALAIAIIVWW